MLDAEYSGYLLSFDGAAKLKSNASSASFVLWRLPEWQPVHAEGIHLAGVTVNEAEYHGMLHGLRYVLRAMRVDEIVVAGDSRIVIQQYQHQINCNTPHLQLLLNEFESLRARFSSVRLVHVKREFNAAADYLTGVVQRVGESVMMTQSEDLSQLEALNTLPSKIVKPATPEVLPRTDALDCQHISDDAYGASDASDDETPGHQVYAVQTRRERAANPGPSVDPAEPADPVQERWRRIREHQDADPELRRLKMFINGELSQLSREDIRDVLKIVDPYVVDTDGTLMYISMSTQPGRLRERSARLVVPRDLQDDVMHLHHGDMQGGHQGITRTYERLRAEYYWRGMFKDVERFVQQCQDCVTSKGAPVSASPSPGNVMPDYPMQIISMDFVIPLPASAQGNTALLLFQDMFSGYVMCKAMKDTAAQAVAEAYEEVAFRRFGASSEIRHDRDPRFMSDVFKVFARMMKSQQRATLAYRPQANGQQERSVQSVVGAIKSYISEPAQEDWEDLAGRLVFALNTSLDATRRETPFSLVHGWDAKTTMAAMLAPKPAPGATKSKSYAWRIDIQRQYEACQERARQLQARAKRSRAEERNAAWEDLPDK
ncbi:hypothetical protein P43SY_005253 [Pythium insidiosum]|uniref:Integrase catalytic domain-containing protein n=1 Tax=Pythium insidiosum TaxID=114742 RepID=A0AAD5MBZ5_PYTIN|nr:hypothetical protein P43SY_005253 [Pythium insidiosum]